MKIKKIRWAKSGDCNYEYGFVKRINIFVCGKKELSNDCFLVSTFFSFNKNFKTIKECKLKAEELLKSFVESLVEREVKDE